MDEQHYRLIADILSVYIEELQRGCIYVPAGAEISARNEVRRGQLVQVRWSDHVVYMFPQDLGTRAVCVCQRFNGRALPFGQPLNNGGEPRFDHPFVCVAKGNNSRLIAATARQALTIALISASETKLCADNFWNGTGESTDRA